LKYRQKSLEYRSTLPGLTNMKKNLSRLVMLTAGAIGLFASSCAYDPYYDGGVGYDSGYYGEGSYSTSLFISTGDSRWGYDPYCHSYYDYHRRAYYDPFLYGYYPVGYRPPVVYGVPHPHGWRPGSRYCPPPSRISSHVLGNYRDREGAYRRSNFSWSQKVRQRDQGTPNFKIPDRTPDRGRTQDNPNFRRENDGNRLRGENRPVQQQFPGFGQNHQRPSGNPGADFRRPERNSKIEAPKNNRSRQIDRSQFENRMRENRQRNSPSPGFNNPVTLSPRQMPQRQAPQLDRNASRERFDSQRTNPEPSFKGSSGGFRGNSQSDSRGERRRH
jgi:hypothetical protein